MTLIAIKNEYVDHSIDDGNEWTTIKLLRSQWTIDTFGQREQPDLFFF